MLQYVLIDPHSPRLSPYGFAGGAFFCAEKITPKMNDVPITLMNATNVYQPFWDEHTHNLQDLMLDVLTHQMEQSVNEESHILRFGDTETLSKNPGWLDVALVLVRNFKSINHKKLDYLIKKLVKIIGEKKQSLVKLVHNFSNHPDFNQEEYDLYVDQITLYERLEDDLQTLQQGV